MKDAARAFFKSAQSSMIIQDLAELRLLLSRLQQIGTTSAPQAYLVVVKDVINLLMKNEKSGNELSELFLPLIPSKRRGAVQALLTEVRRLEKKRSSVANSQLGKYQDSANSSPTRKSELGNYSKKTDCPLKNQQSITKVVTGRSAASHMRAANSERSHYKATSRLLDETNGSIPHVSGKVRKDAVIRLTKCNGSNRKLDTGADPVDLCIRQASENTGKHLRDTKKLVSIRKLNDNLPAGLLCVICETPLKEPMLADCGHSACLSCWLKWFKKSTSSTGSCPVCRKPTSTDSLARMVFEKDAGAGVPTMSQMYCSQADGEETKSPP